MIQFLWAPSTLCGCKWERRCWKPLRVFLLFWSAIRWRKREISLWFPLGRSWIQQHKSWMSPPGPVSCGPTTPSSLPCWPSQWPSGSSTLWGKVQRRRASTTSSPAAGPWWLCPSGCLSAPVLCQPSRFWAFPLRFIITASSSSTCASGKASTPCWQHSSSCQFSFAWESPAAIRSKWCINIDIQPKYRIKVLVVFGLSGEMVRRFGGIYWNERSGLESDQTHLLNTAVGKWKGQIEEVRTDGGCARWYSAVL